MFSTIIVILRVYGILFIFGTLVIDRVLQLMLYYIVGKIIVDFVDL